MKKQVIKKKKSKLLIAVSTVIGIALTVIIPARIAEKNFKNIHFEKGKE